MNSSGQVSVELKLLLDSLRKQAKEAAAILRDALKVGANDVAPGIEKATKKQKELTDEVKKTTKSLKDQKEAALAAWRASLPKPQVFLNGNPNSKPPEGLPEVGTTPWQGPGSGGGLATNPNAYRGPRPPVIPPPIIPPPVQAFAAAQMAMRAAMSTPLAIAAQLGAALAGLRVVIGLVNFAFQKLLVPMRMFLAAAEAAGRQYARALGSGAGLAFSTRQNVLAGIIGVGEDQVLQFATAVDYLNKKVAWSISVFNSTNQQLTALNWEWKVLLTNVSALTALLASGFSPIMIKVINYINAMVKSFELLYYAMEPFLKMVAFTMPFGGNGKPVPPPTTSMNKLASSAWEKMGLVLGNGGQNHAQATARNTYRMTVLMSQMLGVFTRQPGGPAESYNYSRP